MSGCTIFYLHIITYKARLSEKKVYIEHKMCALIFSTNLSETSPISRGYEQDITIKVHGLHYSARYSYQILINVGFCRQINKNTKISNFIKIRPLGTKLFYADKQKNGERDVKVIAAFRNFANSSEKNEDVQMISQKHAPCWVIIPFY